MQPHGVEGCRVVKYGNAYTKPTRQQFKHTTPPHWPGILYLKAHFKKNFRKKARNFNNIRLVKIKLEKGLTAPFFYIKNQRK